MTISNHPIPLFTTKSRYVFKMEPKLGHLVKLWEILGCKYRVWTLVLFENLNIVLYHPISMDHGQS